MCVCVYNLDSGQKILARPTKMVNILKLTIKSISTVLPVVGEIEVFAHRMNVN